MRRSARHDDIGSTVRSRSKPTLTLLVEPGLASTPVVTLANGHTSPRFRLADGRPSRRRARWPLLDCHTVTKAGQESRERVADRRCRIKGLVEVAKILGHLPLFGCEQLFKGCVEQISRAIAHTLSGDPV